MNQALVFYALGFFQHCGTLSAELKITNEYESGQESAIDNPFQEFSKRKISLSCK